MGTDHVGIHVAGFPVRRCRDFGLLDRDRKIIERLSGSSDGVREEDA